VAARGGGGFGCTYQAEVGEPDNCLFRYRDYGTGPATAFWGLPIQYNEIDVTTGRKMTIESVPVLPPAHYAFGTIWIGGGSSAYFDCHQGTGAGQSSAVMASPTPVSVFTRPDGNGQPLNACYSYGGGISDATITLVVRDFYGTPIPFFPAEDAWLGTSSGGLVTCLGGSIADGDTDLNGETTFTNPVFGGAASDYTGGETTVVYVDGMPLPQPGFTDMGFNSADIDGDLLVNLTDVVFFAGVYHGAYEYYADFCWDGLINLTDIVLLAQAMTAECPTAAPLAAGLEDLGTMGVYFDRDGSERTLQVEPGTEFKAFLLASGPVTQEGIHGWQCRLSLSENIVVTEWSYPTESLNLASPPEFVVGAGSPDPLPVHRGKTLLLTLRARVSDTEPAFIHLDGGEGQGEDATAPLCATGEKARLRGLSLPAGGSAAAPVAYINDIGGLVAKGLPPAELASLDLHNAPNPFNPSTVFKFNLARAGRVEVRIYDASGRLIQELDGGTMSAGPRQLTWNGRDLRGAGVASGVYFYRLLLDGESLGPPVKMSLIK